MTAHEASSDLREQIATTIGTLLPIRPSMYDLADAVLALVSPLLDAKDAEIRDLVTEGIRQKRRAIGAEAAVERVRALCDEAEQANTPPLIPNTEVLFLVTDIRRALAGDAAPEPTYVDDTTFAEAAEIEAKRWRPLLDRLAEHDGPAPEQDGDE